MSAHGKLKTASQLGIGAKLSASEVDELLLDMVSREAETRKRVRDAQLEVDRLADIVFTCDGIECVKHDVLVRNAVDERRRAAADARHFAGALREIEIRAWGCMPLVAKEIGDIARAALTRIVESEDHPGFKPCPNCS